MTTPTQLSSDLAAKLGNTAAQKAQEVATTLREVTDITKTAVEQLTVLVNDIDTNDPFAETAKIRAYETTQKLQGIAQQLEPIATVLDMRLTLLGLPEIKGLDTDNELAHYDTLLPVLSELHSQVSAIQADIDTLQQESSPVIKTS